MKDEKFLGDLRRYENLDQLAARIDQIMWELERMRQFVQNKVEDIDAQYHHFWDDCNDSKERDWLNDI